MPLRPVPHVAISVTDILTMKQLPRTKLLLSIPKER